VEARFAFGSCQLLKVDHVSVRSASTTALALASRVDNQQEESAPAPSTSSSSSAATEEHPDVANKALVLTDHPVLGDVRRIRVPGQEDFVAKMAVPTYACVAPSKTDRCDYSSKSARSRRRLAADGEPNAGTVTSDVGGDRTQQMKFRGLEGAVEPGPAFVLDNVLSRDECNGLIEGCETLGFGRYQAGKNHHGALQLVVSEALARQVSRRLSRHVNVREVDNLRRQMDGAVRNQNRVDGEVDDSSEDDDVRLEYRGLNRRWRVYRYEPGGIDHFAPHIDAGFPPSGLSDDGAELVWDCSDNTEEDIVSRLTILFYLNDDFDGGRTTFFEPVGKHRRSSTSDASASPPSLQASVRPVAGSCLVFPQGVGEDAVEYAREHWPLHEGSPVAIGSAQPKYVIRSDVLFATVREAKPSPVDGPLFRYDSVVRQTFLPTSSVMDTNFMSHVESLYNPHMGVENLGPFLYSFVRFTKVRHVLEIGAGYTTLWILQALRDNHDEMDRIHKLQEAGQCRLLDWPWTNEERVNRLVDPRQRPATLLCVDNCAHQKETASGAAAVAQALGLDSFLQFRRGDAFELTLERESLDVVWCDFGVGSRMKDFCATTWDSLRPGGILLCHSTLTNQRTRGWLEAGEYVEVSLLEPHKHYQNSISIFQKRRGFTEPVYSEFA
jgi:predicted O-methyltransferase YrrM